MNQQNFQNQQAAQMGMTMQQMQAQAMMGNRSQLQPGFGVPPQAQPGQPQVIPMQQQLSQHQRLVQNGNLSEAQQPIHGGLPVQNIPRSNPANRGQPSFTAEENQHIYMSTRQMLSRMSEQDKVGLNNRLATTLPHQQQQMIQAQGMDLVTAYVRNQVAQNFASEKQKKLQALGQSQRPTANGALPNQGRPVSQVSVRGQQPTHAPPTTQQPELSVGMGKLDQFVGQQQEGLRHQAAGQDVVPASNGQTVPPQMRGTPHQPAQGQFAMNKPMQAPAFPSQAQNQWNNNQNQQPKVQQTPQVAMQPPTSNFAIPGQTSQPQALQGQAGGLTGNHGQRTPQQNHNMPTLNRPMDAPNQPKNDMMQRPSQPTPKQSQRNGPNALPSTANSSQPGLSQQGQAWAKIPPKLQQQLQRMPEEARKAFLMELQKKQQQQKMKAAVEAQSNGNIQNATRAPPQGPATGAKAPQADNAQPMNNPQATPIAHPTGQLGGNSFDRATMMNAQGSQQAPPDPAHPAQARLVPMPMTTSQLNVMDNYPIPPVFLSKTNLGQLPEGVKTWRQMKEYVQSRPHFPPSVMQEVLSLQSIHMQQLTANKQRMAMAQNAQPRQPGQAPQASMIPQRPNQPPVPSVLPSGQPPMPNIPQPTIQEIHTARATLPENQRGLTDQQISMMIMQRRQQQFIQFTQQRMNQQMLQRQNLEQMQRMNDQGGRPPSGQSQYEQMQQALRVQGHPVPSPQQPTPQLQPPKQQVGVQGRPTLANRPSQVPPGQQNDPKRQNNDDVIEVPDPKIQQQQRTSNSRPSQPFQGHDLQRGTQGINDKDAQKQGRMQVTHSNQRPKPEANNRNESAQNSAVSNNLNAGANMRRDPFFEGLMAEVARTTPQKPIVPMNPEMRNQMIAKVKDKTAAMIQRTEQTLPLFLQRSKNKDQVKELLRIVSPPSVLWR